MVLFILTTLLATSHWLAPGHRNNQVFVEMVAFVLVWGFVGAVLWDSKRLDDNDYWDL